MCDIGHEAGREDPPQDREYGKCDKEHVEDRARKPHRGFIVAARDEFREDGNERTDERAVEDAEEDRRNRRRGQERIHTGRRTEVLRVDDLSTESQYR